MDEYKAKYRNFSPLDTVYVQNPFDEDVSWKVADDSNRQWEYRIAAHEKAELPGGLIATLGVKHLVDRLIMEANEEVQMWEKDVRARYEEKVILRVKDGHHGVESSKPDVTREVDLTMRNEDVLSAPEPESPVKVEAPKAQPKVETEFPDLKKATSKLPKEAEVKA